jgi:micrococcal nuclease
VRLILINAPESKNSLYKKEEPYGKEAKRWLEQCLPKNCILRFEFDKQKTDKFNRILAYVYYDNIMINEKMVREGYAQYAEYRPNIKYSKRILKAEIIAKKLKKGIWKNKKFSF